MAGKRLFALSAIPDKDHQELFHPKKTGMSRIPTTDLYFLNSCGHKVGGWFRRRPIRWLGRNSFVTGNTRLLIRRDTDTIMNAMVKQEGRLVYLVDDDIEGAAASGSLPPDYRRRLLDFHERHHRALTRRADTLVVTSAVLRDLFAWHRDVRLVHPVWHLPMADASHFNDIEHGASIHAVHLGSGSHSDGITFLRPVLQELLERQKRLHFTYVSAADLLGALDRHPRVKRMAPRSWKSYSRWIKTQRFHIGLYPLPNTPFHRARSHNKLLEYGAVGAVGAYSSHWQPAHALRGGAILCGPEQRLWTDTLSDVLACPTDLAEMVTIARKALDQLNDPADQRRFWSSVLEVDCS